jgi:peptide chain release factor 1
VQVAVSGAGTRALFQNESGGHRWQRIPPTEKRGRVHTSTVTVAVLDPDAIIGRALDPRDVEIVTARGSGPGGQHRNKTESCVVATHRPSGLSVRIDMRSQHQSRAMAMKVLAARLYEAEREKALAQREQDRKQQVGSGMRGDKIRTYRTQDDQVNDHRTGQRWRLNTWLKGEW